MPAGFLVGRGFDRFGSAHPPSGLSFYRLADLLRARPLPRWRLLRTSALSAPAELKSPHRLCLTDWNWSSFWLHSPDIIQLESQDARRWEWMCFLTPTGAASAFPVVGTRFLFGSGDHGQMAAQYQSPSRCDNDSMQSDHLVVPPHAGLLGCG